MDKRKIDHLEIAKRNYEQASLTDDPYVLTSIYGSAFSAASIAIAEELRGIREELARMNNRADMFNI